MALIPRVFSSGIFDPFSSIVDPFEKISLSLFDTAFPSFDDDVSAVANTRLDWLETPEAHVFKADLPGIKKEEIKIQLGDNGVLSISGERGKEKVDEKDSIRRTERSYGKFYRQFKLPSNAKTEEGISAKLENGVLTVTVPKAKGQEEKPPVRNIEISS